VRALIQRVSRASVTVEGRRVGEIGPGLLVLLGVTHQDGPPDVEWLARRVAGLRVFPDAQGRMNLALAASGGAARVVPQFTLYGDARRGQRPDFAAAARPEQAEPLCAAFCEALTRAGLRVERGVFRAHMVVELVNDGPVTLMVESPVVAAAEVGEQGGEP
jgi:D-tyrosyl-tRNA(Tyr) deacylase